MIIQYTATKYDENKKLTGETSKQGIIIQMNIWTILYKKMMKLQLI